MDYVALEEPTCGSILWGTHKSSCIKFFLDLATQGVSAMGHLSSSQVTGVTWYKGYKRIPPN